MKKSSRENMGSSSNVRKAIEKTIETLKSISNIEKSLLGKSFQSLPNTETINNVISCLKVEKTRINKILPISTQYSYVGIGCLENPSNTQKSFLEKIIQHLPNMETRFACGGGAAN